VSLGSAMCGGMRGVDCPVSSGLFSTLMGCIFQWGVVACVSRSFMVRVGVGRRSNFSCIIVSGAVFWHIRVSRCAPEPYGGASKVMMGVNNSCLWGCSLMLGVLASMYPFPVGCELSRNCSSLTRFFSVFSGGWVACRVVWVVGG